eukprot:gene8245-9797_t
MGGGKSKGLAGRIVLVRWRDVGVVGQKYERGVMIVRWVGQKYEREGMIKQGALMINAVTNSAVPAITIQMGASYGAGKKVDESVWEKSRAKLHAQVENEGNVYYTSSRLIDDAIIDPRDTRDVLG